MKNRRGMALPLALFVLLVVGALVGAAFWLGVADHRAGLGSLALQEALGEAERAAQVVISQWESGRLNSMAVSATSSGTVLRPDGALRATTGVRRLSSSLFLVTARGFSRSGAATQRVGVLVRLEAPRLGFRQPLLAAGPVQLGPDAQISHPTVDPLDYCGSHTQADGGSAEETGKPSYEDFATWVGRATKVVPAGRYWGVGPSYDAVGCRVDDPRNWGDPHHPASACGAYLPVVYAPGDLVVIGGIGQGVLLVAGDLTLSAGFSFQGLVLVAGELALVGVGTGVVGAVQIGSEMSGGVVAMEGSSAIEYSACALRRALASSSRGAPLRRRSWINAY